MNIYTLEELVKKQTLKDKKVTFALGVFESVHLGHQRILKTLREKSDFYSSLSMVITFCDNPKKTMDGDIDTIRLRTEKIRSLSIDTLCVIDFSRDFANMKADEFIALLAKCFKPVHAVAGSDLKFGHPGAFEARGEDIPSLFSNLGISCGVSIVDFVSDSEGRKISSSYLRKLIGSGDVEIFTSLTGQSYRVDLLSLKDRYRSKGIVKISRSLVQQILPPPGLYEAELTFLNGKRAQDATMDTTSLSFSLPLEGFPDSIYFIRRKK